MVRGLIVKKTCSSEVVRSSLVAGLRSYRLVCVVRVKLNPVAGSLFGAALFLRELVRYSAVLPASRWLGVPVWPGGRGQQPRRFGGLGQLERALPVLRRFPTARARLRPGAAGSVRGGWRRRRQRQRLPPPASSFPVSKCMARQFDAESGAAARPRPHACRHGFARALLASFSALRRRVSKTAGCMHGQFVTLRLLTRELVSGQWWHRSPRENTALSGIWPRGMGANLCRQDC